MRWRSVGPGIRDKERGHGQRACGDERGEQGEAAEAEQADGLCPCQGGHEVREHGQSVVLLGRIAQADDPEGQWRSRIEYPALSGRWRRGPCPELGLGAVAGVPGWYVAARGAALPAVMKATSWPAGKGGADRLPGLIRTWPGWDVTGAEPLCPPYRPRHGPYRAGKAAWARGRFARRDCTPR
jgi:hypothetical protein